MNKFVKCVSLDDNREKLVALDNVRCVHRNDNPERAAIIEDYNNRFYECVHEQIFCPHLEDCIVEL